MDFEITRICKLIDIKNKNDYKNFSSVIKEIENILCFYTIIETLVIVSENSKSRLIRASGPTFRTIKTKNV
jgi:hypothetical protein